MFSDHAVLQQDIALPIWGTADAGEEIMVSFGHQKLTTTADSQGRWSIRLKPIHAPEAGTLTITGKNTLTFSDVVAGEVWFCSGQSNMALTLRGVTDAAREIASANDPDIRQFHVPLKTSPRAEDFTFLGNTLWKPCIPANVTDYTAVGYFFAREVRRELGVPIGIINSSWGGTPIYPWIDIPVLQSVPSLYENILKRKHAAMVAFEPTQAKFDESLVQWKAAADQAASAGKSYSLPKPTPPGSAESPQQMPALLTNGMLHPLLPYAIRGALWYQGEGNAGGGRAGATEYAQMQTLLIKNWRDLWGEGDFPFYFVQLPNWQVPDKTGESWAYFREAQAKSVAESPDVAMAVTIDVGESATLHPRNKQAVGHRLALIALAKCYGKALAWEGPTFRMMKIEDGGRVQITFDHTNEGLFVKGGGEVTNFTVAGADLKFVPAEAKIDGRDAVLVSSVQVPLPVAVRYAWGNDPVGVNLFNSAGLPAAPFRSDGEAKATGK